MGAFATRLQAALKPWDNGPVVAGSTDLKRYLRAAAAMFEPVATFAEEAGSDGTAGYVPPYGTLFAAASCPKDAMQYLAQYVGVSLPAGGSEAEWRAILKAESGLARGTRGSLEALLRKALGATPFYVLERTQTVAGDNAYWLTVIIPAGHVTEAIYPEITATIPAGIMYTILEREGTWFVVAGGKAWSAVKAGLKWSEAKEGEP